MRFPQHDVQSNRAPNSGAFGSARWRSEAKAICETDHGQWVDQDPVVGCKIGGITTFACKIEQRVMATCTRFKEGAVLTEVRDAMVDDYGQPESQTVEGDYRVYSWSGGTVTITGYARGVKVTKAVPNAGD